MHHASGLELEIGDTDSVFDEQDILRAFHVDVQGTVFIPIRRRFVGFAVFQVFDGYIGKRLVSKIFIYVGKVAFGETDFSLLDF